MSRILVLGASPLPFEPQERQHAANHRTWQFARTLIDEGQEVRLIGCRLRLTYPEGTEPVLSISKERLQYYSVADQLFEDPAFLQHHHDEFRPDGIVGVTTHPASRAVRVVTEKPIWCDLHGWTMAEAQAKAFTYDNDRYLSHFWKMEQSVLDRGDAFSTVSQPQAYATIGELAARGRLGRENFGYEFVHSIPTSISDTEYVHNRTVVRGSIVPEDAFVVLWAGGYNTWTDVDLLYEALAAAMDEVPNLYFVSTGGALEGHDDITFSRFRERVRGCSKKARFHFAGWVPTVDVPSYYFESNLGINVDSSNYETVFGARTRLNDMMHAGLPVLTTTGTEISQIIAENRLGLTCGSREAAEFAERLVWAARHPEKIAAMGRLSRDYVEEEFSYARTTEPLRAWAAEPRRAPDLGKRVEFDDIDFFDPSNASSPSPDGPATLKERLRASQSRASEAEARYHQVRRELGNVHQSRMWRVWMRYLALRAWLARPFSHNHRPPRVP